MVEAYTKLKDWSAAWRVLEEAAKLDPDNPEYRSWKSYLKFMQEGTSESGFDDLKGVVQDHPSSFTAHLHLAILMWNSDASYREDKTKCLAMFLKAAKLDVFSGETFLYLGHYYRDVSNDSVRATKCYEKAYKLSPGSEPVGCALADQYIDQGKLGSATTIYEAATTSAPTSACKWAWLRLGLCRLKQNEINTAIKCFQAVLRAAPEDYICWECLGDGYLTRGSYTAAWKAFNRAHELEPASVYSVYQMATIKKQLLRFSEAVTEYHFALEISPHYVPALKGLGESHLSLARIMLKEGRDPTCVDYVNKAIEHLISALTIRSELSCIWKLLGDCMTIIHPLDSDIARLMVPNNHLVITDTEVISKTQALQIGGRCYLRALQLRDQATLWEDLGINYFHQAKMSGTSEESKDMGARAVQTIQQAIMLYPSNHQLWNSLGVITSSKYAQDPALAQHSFIKSIELEPNNVVAWTNLGVLYLDRGNIELAHKAFQTAQCLDPGSINCWIGQGLVAESVGSEEAMGLFRHATELGLHDQASIGYATWVCNVMAECKDHDDVKYRENIRDLNALSASVTAMSKYCCRYPDRSWALSIFGFLLEKSGLNRLAEDAYKSALDILSRFNDSSQSNQTLIDRAKSDYSRILRKNTKHSSSVEVLLSSSCLKYSDLYALAISYYALGELPNSLSALFQAKEVAKSDAQRSQVALALAALSWKQGDAQKSKRLLRENSLESSQALCAIGILETDVIVIEQSLQDLVCRDVIITGCTDVIFDNCLLISASMMKIKGYREACRVVQKYTHRFPYNWQLRHLLSRFLRLMEAKNCVDLSLLNAQSAKIFYSNDKREKPLERDAIVLLRDHRSLMANHSMTALAAGKHCDVIGRRGGLNSLKEAQKFVHCHPYSVESWAVLAGACHARSVYERLRGCIGGLKKESERIATFVASQSEAPIRDWMVKLHMLSCLGDHGRVKQLFSQVESEDAESILLLSRLAVAPHPTSDSALSDISRFTSKGIFSIMLAQHTFSCLGMSRQSYAMLNQALQCSVDRNHKLSVLIRMTEVALEASKSDSSNHDEWLSKARDVISDVTKLSGDSHIVQLLQGLFHEATGKHKKALTWLHKVLDNPRSSMDLCQSRYISARKLCQVYREKDDDLEMEKLLKKWTSLSGDHMMRAVSSS